MNNSTRISVITNTELKEKVKNRAIADGMTLSSLTNQLYRWYASGEIALTFKPTLTENGFTEQEETEMLIDIENAKNSINVSSPLSGDAVIKHLQNL